MALGTNYRVLQAYGGVGKVASGTQVLADANETQFTTMDAALGPTAYNVTAAADFDDVTVLVSGIYEVVFEANTHNGEEGNTVFRIRDDGTIIAGCLAESHFGSTAAEFSMFKQVSIRGIAQIAAGSVLDVTVQASSACTLTTRGVRFWVRKIADLPA